MTEATSLVGFLAAMDRNESAFSTEFITQLCEDLGQKVAAEFESVGHIVHGVQVQGYQCIVSVNTNASHQLLFLTFSSFGGFKFSINSSFLYSILNRRKARLNRAFAVKILNTQVDFYNSYIAKFHRRSLSSLSDAFHYKSISN